MKKTVDNLPEASDDPLGIDLKIIGVKMLLSIDAFHTPAMETAYWGQPKLAVNPRNSARMADWESFIKTLRHHGGTRMPAPLKIR